MIWLLVTFWLAGCLAIGFPLARLVLRDERRLFVLLAFGIIAGHSSQAILLVYLWRWMILGTAIVVAPIACAAAGVLLWRGRHRETWADRLCWGLSPGATGLVFGLAALFALAAYWVFIAAAHAGWTEALFHHAGITSWLERGLLPPTNPLEPDDPLHYRIGIFAIAAGLSSASGALPPEGLATTLALLTSTMVFALVGATVRLLNRPCPGVIASIVGLFGGSLYPYYRLLESTVQPQVPFAGQDLLSPLWVGSTIYQLYLNPTIGAGFIVFAGALWVCWEVLRQERPGKLTWLVGTISLAWLGVVNEVYFAALLGGIAVASGFSLLFALRNHEANWWRLPRNVLAMFLVALGIIEACGGILGGVAVAGDKAGSVDLLLNTGHIGYLPHAPSEIDGRWLPIVSIQTFLDTDLLALVLPILLAFIVKGESKSRGYLLAGLASSIAILLAWIAVYPGYRPADAYRFGQAGVTIFLALTPITLASMSFRRPLGPALLRRLGLIATAVIILPSIAFTAYQVLTPPTQEYLVPGSPDTEAALYLRRFDDTYRVLVPLKDPVTGWAALYIYKDFNMSAGTLLALSRHSIPMGEHQGPHNPQRYVAAYHEASLTFDAAALAKLKVDWVYVVPSDLDLQQLAHLRSAQDSGELKLEKSFGEHGTPSERLLFRVSSRH